MGRSSGRWVGKSSFDSARNIGSLGSARQLTSPLTAIGKQQIRISFANVIVIRLVYIAPHRDRFIRGVSDLKTEMKVERNVFQALTQCRDQVR